MKNIRKRFVGLILIVVFFFSVNYVNALGNPGEIILNKTAQNYNLPYGRKARVNLEIKSNPFVTVEKTDVVLVLDRSTSMNGTRMDDTKKAALDLIDLLLTEETKSNVRVGIVTYGLNVFNNWSSSKLTNDAESLKNIVNDIPIDTDISGTNIHAGLLQAQSLLEESAKDRDKVVILLSDGLPNRYMGTDIETICKNSSDSSVCNSNSSDSAIEVANSMKSSLNKNGAITIYTIGFNVEVTSDAYILLGDIASEEDNRFAATDYSNLKTTFEEIVEAIHIVATKGVVTDVIPSGFKLVKNSLSEGASLKENSDGTTTIIWNIGNIDSNQNLLLSYEVEAANNNYGSMYTNVVATLEAAKAKENPAYSNSDIILLFPVPVVPIPAVTNDDDYGDIQQGDKLVVNIDNNILTNDELLIKHLDENAKVDNKIVLVATEDVNGDINKMLLDEEDGTFTYDTSLDELGEITYKYYIESVIEVNGVTTVVKSNISTITFNIIKNQTSYIVNYLENGTNKVLHTPKEVVEYAFEEITEKAIKIEGYDLISGNDQTIKLEIDPNKNIINFYYEQVIGKVIVLYVDIKGNILAESIEMSGIISEGYKTSAKAIDNYELIGIDGDESGKYTKENIIVKYIYDLVKDDSDIPEIPQTGLNFNITYCISIGFIILITILAINKKHIC